MTAEAVRVGGAAGTICKMAREMVPDGNLNACLTCGTCSSGCPATGQFDMDPRKFLRMAVLGMDETLEKHPWAWVCTMCRRCYDVCPMKINIPALIFEIRARWPEEEKPKGVLESCRLHVKSRGGAMGVPFEDFKFTVEDLAEECREQPGFEELQAPIDKPGAMYALNQNSREPVVEPDELLPLWKILHTVGADWTYYSEMWAGENYCMFLADDKSWEYIVRAQVEHLNKLGVKYFVNTECGHSFYAIYGALRRFNIQANFEFISIIQLYAKWIREGKLPVNSDWNKELGIKFTVQDPCNIIRKSLGDEMAEDLRFVVKTAVGEENFIDMVPNRSNNYCCGGGGGALQAGFTEQRRAYGKIKFDQIDKTGAAYVITPCHNCHAQVEDIGHHFGGEYHTVHLWTILCLSMGILGENERTYLGPDLADFGL
ncbi:(Fe-S)-binding protein [Desulfobotulus sp.]|uniref:(Fe-S)-binding protein n=1 Tax=Desulfobotulus sp. TaxID=1940337 RepID=UPI002A370CAC|nr:(Fe-S)-binding protein [Desulfobotulus sp.]MDY0164159.1 (Fe-S)-binding protein [Desulfobotulus sp.]